MAKGSIFSKARGRSLAGLAVAAWLSVWPGSALAAGISVTASGPGLTATDLADLLVGGGMTVSNAVLTGASLSAGTFTGGAGIVDFNAGVVLSSGWASGLPGPNSTGAYSNEMGTPGDPLLGALAGGASTADAAELDFDFVPSGGLLRFSYVFGSDEYPEYVGSQYNDVFGIFVNGVNTALIPGTSQPVSINNVNSGLNASYFRDNSGGAYNTQMDGFTTGLAAYVTVTPGVVNHIKFAICDVGDEDFDSWVLIQAGSLMVLTPTGTITPTPSITASLSATPSDSVSPTISPTFTLSATASASPTVSPSCTDSPSPSITPTLTDTPTVTPTPSVTQTLTPTPTLTITRTFSPSPTITLTATVTPTYTPTPRPLTLSRRSPNPDPASGVAVWLPYTLSVDATVTIKVYDVAGEGVKRFEPVARRAGDHEERWDLCNDASQKVASGVYLCRIQADDAHGGTATVWEKCSVAR